VSEDLVAWLRVQIDEDERDASDVHLSGCDVHTRIEGDPWPGPCDCGWPAQILAEVEAKRRILDRYEEAVRRAATKPGYDAVARLETALAKVTAPELERVVRLLALPYAGRDGWREEWRP
jgi:hypothetical protein